MTLKHSLGTQIEPATLRVERTLPAPVERVWAYLVDPEKAQDLAGRRLHGSKRQAACSNCASSTTELSGEEAPEHYAAYRKTHNPEVARAAHRAAEAPDDQLGQRERHRLRSHLRTHTEGRRPRCSCSRHRRLPDRKGKR